MVVKRRSGRITRRSTNIIAKIMDTKLLQLSDLVIYLIVELTRKILADVTSEKT